jgi:hypothetical protein
MDDGAYRSFFLQPADPRQRQYEALRAFFIDRQPMSAIAQQLGYRHDTIRRLVSHFRRDFDRQSLPPFSSSLLVADRQSRMPRASRRKPTAPRSLTSAPYR